MKKIGIMTWFSYNNYGTLLQVYALSKKIESKARKVEIINYKPKVHKKNIFDMNITYVLNQIKEKYNIKKNYEREKNIKNKFDDFRKNYLNIGEESKNHYQLKKTADSMEKIICGSDQIWSPTFFDPHYYLDFVDDNSKKIAYAPSFGVSKIDNKDLKNEIKALLSSFNELSVREEHGKKIIEELVNTNTKVVLDPTLLLTKEEWINSLGISEKKTNNKYLFCYFLGNKKEYIKIAKQMSKQLNLHIKILPTNSLANSFEKESIITDCGPKEFVEHINNASYILTDSYHGILFSINFNKPFIALKRFNDNKESQNSRVYNILKKLDLENKLCSLKKLNLDNIDFDKVNKKLEILKKESILYLNKQIEKSGTPNEPEITNNCTGCGMCAAVCPKKCINIVKNDNGFYEYHIDKNKCINCNLCKKVCGQFHNNSVLISNQNLYSAHSKNNKILMSSSSGGVAFFLASAAIENSIPVIGCTYNNQKHRAEHILINCKDDIKYLSGSKYLQSYTVNAFKEIKKLEKAMIIGTPCQISSIDNYLRIIGKRDKFILVDLICHGVPTYYLWDRIIKEHDNVDIVKFRDKKYKNKKKLTINSKAIKNNVFYDFFDSSTIYNKCCYDCNYREYMSSDIRIGDYWGKKSRNGISKVLINTKIGQDYFNKISKYLVYTNEDSNNYFKNQLKSNLPILPIRTQIIKDLKNNNIKLKTISKKYCKKIIIDNKIKTRLYKAYKKILKK